jgi:hypothetical protein
MADIIVKSITRFSTILKGLKDQFDEIDQIKMLSGTQLDTFKTAFGRINDSLEKFTYVFQDGSPHNDLFNHKLLKFSQIDAITLKLEPLNTLLNLLSRVKHTPSFRERMSLYWELYMLYNRPSMIRAQLKRHFKIIENALPIIIELNRTIFGSAMRIKQPILRKAWMLAGENQLNDSSLPINILQDNLYMLVKLEIGEKTINNMRNKDQYKNIINQIVIDIDNRGATEGDGNISLAELNDLPDIFTEKITDDVCDIDDTAANADDDTDNVCKRIDHEPVVRGCWFGYPIKTSKVCASVPTQPSDSSKSRKVKKREYIVFATNFFDKYKSYLKSKKDKGGGGGKRRKRRRHGRQSRKRDNETNDNGDDDDDDTDDAGYMGLASLLCDIDIEDNIKVSVPISLFKDRMVVYGSSPQNNPPKSVKDYGYDFVSTKVASLEIKSSTEYIEYNEKLKDTETILTNITFAMTVTDQGWGGSNNVHVRYQINRGNCVKAFTVTRNSNETAGGEYTFVINGYELNKIIGKKMIHIWLYCPPWSGWEAVATSISCEINYN